MAPGDAVDLCNSDEEHADEAHKLRKQLGIPEFDPDALPSANISKYLILDRM